MAPDKARVAVVQFSEDARLEIGLGDQPDASKLRWAIGRIQYVSGTTFTGNAMKFALEKAFKLVHTPYVQIIRSFVKC